MNSLLKSNEYMAKELNKLNAKQNPVEKKQV